MRRVGIAYVNKLLSVLPVLVCLGAAGASVAGEVAGASPPGGQSAVAERSAIATGLGEVELSRAFPDAAVWLTLEDGGRALGLFFPEREPPAEGAMVILSDVGANAASGLAGGLKAHLVERGWAVLSLGLPAPPIPLQRDLEADSTPDSPASGEAVGDEESSVMIDVMASADAHTPEQSYRHRIRQSLEAAVAELASKGYERPVLVGVGRASNHLVGALPAVSDPRALVWVVPAFYPRDAAALADGLLPAAGVNILELYPSGSKEVSEQRWTDLRQAGIAQFERQPVSLQRPPATQSAGALASRIDAWLRSP